MGEIKYCKSCNTANPITAKFCIECGESEFVTKVTSKERYCIYCGIKLDSFDDSCPLCGEEKYASSLDELIEIKNRKLLSEYDLKIENAKETKEQIDKEIASLEYTKRNLENSIEDIDLPSNYLTILAEKKNIADEKVKLAKKRKNDELKEIENIKQHQNDIALVKKAYDDLASEYDVAKEELDLVLEEVRFMESTLNELEDKITVFETELEKKTEDYKGYRKIYLAYLFRKVGLEHYKKEMYPEAEYYLSRALKYYDKIEDVPAYLVDMYMDQYSDFYNYDKALEIIEKYFNEFENSNKGLEQAAYLIACSCEGTPYYNPYVISEFITNGSYQLSKLNRAHITLLMRLKLFPQAWTLTYHLLTTDIKERYYTYYNNKLSYLKDRMSKEEYEAAQTLVNFKDGLYFRIVAGWPDVTYFVRLNLNNWKKGFTMCGLHYKILDKNKVFITYLSKALEAKEPLGMFEYAMCLIEGCGVKKDYKQAGKIFKELYEMNSLYGHVGLALLSLYGYGCDFDEEKGLKYLEFAVSYGNSRAMMELGAYYVRKGMYTKASPYIEEALNKKELAHLYKALIELNKTPMNKKAFFENAEKGRCYSYEAGYLVGLAYEKGIHVDVDEERAISRYNEAAQNGVVDAIKALLKIYKDKGNNIKIEQLNKMLKKVSEKNDQK